MEMQSELVRSASASQGVDLFLPLVSRTVAVGEWDSLVSAFDGVCQEQLVAFAQLRWPSVQLEPRLYERNGTVVGGVLMMVQNLPFKLGAIAIAKWAPMLANWASPTAQQDYADMVSALQDEYARERGMMISILPHTSTGGPSWEYAALRGAGFERGHTLTYPDRYLVQLRLSDEEQRKSFDQTWRRQLAKAEKSNLRFEHAGAGDLPRFKALYMAMSERKHFPDSSAFDTLDALMELPDVQRPEIFFVYQGDNCVAGAVIFTLGKRAVYLYGATNHEALPLRAGYFMHRHVISWLRDHSAADWYDLGGTDGFLGLHQFKKGMVGAQGVIVPVPPVVNFATSTKAYRLGTAALWARELMNKTRRVLERQFSTKARSDQPLPPLDAQFK